MTRPILTRRRFIEATTCASLTALIPNLALSRVQPFNLNYAPHAGLFEHTAGTSIVDQIAFAADAGFTAWEDNDMRGRAVHEQEDIAAAMRRHDMTLGGSVGAGFSWVQPGITCGDYASGSRFLSDFRDSVEVAKRVNANWMTIVPAHVDPRIHPLFQMANVVETLKQACTLLVPHGLIMVL